MKGCCRWRCTILIRVRSSTVNITWMSHNRSPITYAWRADARAAGWFIHRDGRDRWAWSSYSCEQACRWCVMYMQRINRSWMNLAWLASQWLWRSFTTPTYKINKLKEKHLQNEGIVLPMPWLLSEFGNVSAASNMIAFPARAAEPEASGSHPDRRFRSRYLLRRAGGGTRRLISAC
jgi:hypothetical protein